jgi:arylsulfatase A-like enzyme
VSRREGRSTTRSLGVVALLVLISGAVLAVGSSARVPPQQELAYRPARSLLQDRASKRRPNIVFILSDDQRFDTLWAMPNVERLLVAHGVDFEQAIVSDSLCCPSRASILTGNYAHTTGVYGNGPPNGGWSTFYARGDDRSDIAVWLHAAGYRTGLYGKYLNGTNAAIVPPGWDEFHAFHHGQGYYGFTLGDNGHIHTYPKSVYSTRYLGDQAVRFIRSTPRGKPMFLYYAPYAPHKPAVPENRYAHLPVNLRHGWPTPNLNERDVSDKPAWVRATKRYTPLEWQHLHLYRTRQYQSARTIDDEVGSIVDALRATGRLANTMIVYMSDNGVEWGAHRLLPALKRTPYEEAIRVPLVIRYDPWTRRPRADRKDVVANIDLAPTFASFAGASHPRTEGRSLLPLLEGTPVRWRSYVLLEHWDRSPKTRDPTFCGVRSAGYMYDRYATGEQELYDLRRDPFELRNLAHDPAHSAEVRRLNAVMRRLCKPPPPGYTP